MWEYNYTIPNDNELYHYGVLGMKWGKRKKYYNANGSLNSAGKARQDYKNAKKSLKSARKDYARIANRSFGIKGINASKAAEKKVHSADQRTINAKAKFNASKASNSAKAQKAEMKTYVKEMKKSGLSGSVLDKRSDGRSTRIYNDLKTRKGKAYADKVQKKVEKKLVSQLVGGTAVAIGAIVAESILIARS